MEEEKKASSTDSPPPRDIVGSSPPVPSTYIKPQGRKPHDPDIKFEEYFWYAKRTREEEKTIESPKTNWRALLFKKSPDQDNGNVVEGKHQLSGSNYGNRTHRLEISDEEWTNASRAFRTAGWGACEYLPMSTDMTTRNC